MVKEIAYPGYVGLGETENGSYKYLEMIHIKIKKKGCLIEY